MTSTSAAARRKQSVMDVEPKERPPWRATAKPVKEPNTNALLKAKLLDASRRALRAMKSNSVACQTDFLPTVLMKDAWFNVQTDLVRQRDVGILTDGTVTIRNIPPGTLFFTHTISQMTELLNTSDAETQTALPTSRIGSLMKYTTSADAFDSIDKALSVNAEKIKEQTEELKEFDEDLDFINQSYLRRRPSLSLDPEAAERFRLQLEADERQEEEETGEGHHPGIKIQKFNLANCSTHSLWQSLETSDEDSDAEAEDHQSREQRRKSIERENNLFIRTRLRGMKLAPLSPHHSRRDKSPGWSASQQQAIDDLIAQVSDLFDIFNDISIILGPDLRFITDLPLTVDMEIPQLKCSLVIKKSRENLSEKLSKIKSLPLDSDKSLSEELLTKYSQ